MFRKVHKNTDHNHGFRIIQLLILLPHLVERFVMSVDLSKRSERLKISLQKKNIESIRMQVACAVDRSGSMHALYNNQTVQEYMERLMPIGLKFDDNGQIDAWAFTTDASRLEAITLGNLEHFVHDQIDGLDFGGTSFEPVLAEVERHYFKHNDGGRGFFSKFFKKEENSDSTDPVYLIFQTDGDNDDARATDNILSRLENEAIYIQFVGVGNDTSFSFIKKMADKYTNVGYMHVADLANTSDDDIYGMLINDELKTFLTTKYPSNITVA